MISKIKIVDNFISNNYLTEILQNIESFQHANVFGLFVLRKRFFGSGIYIILTLKVNYKQVQKPKINSTTCMKTIYSKLLLLLLMLPFSALAQSTLKGIVSDATSGQPIPGVNIVVEGSTNGTSTDINGNFTLTNIKSGDLLVFSFLGYADQIVTYDGQATLNVSLKEDATQLQEVVVIGYGTTTKKDATGALTNITAEQFNKGPVVGAEQLIQGRVSGVQVVTAGGEPGSGSLVRIRSGSSYIQNDPLYVIDGVPVEVGGNGVKGGRNPLANINQNDIASMTVLKDAAATAIYGSRASNGVIIITTKKGQSGELKVTYNGNFQVSEVAKTAGIMSADQYRNFVNNHPNATPAQKALLGTANTNWQDEIFRTAFGTDHNIALSGGTDNLTYRTSVGYTNMNGILKHDNFQRTTLSGNIIGNFFDRHLKIEVNNKTTVIDNNFSEKGAIGAAAAFDPTQPVRQQNNFGGYFQWATNGAYEVNAGRNPVSLIEQKHNFGTTYRSIGNAQFEYKIHSFEELKLVANFGYDYAQGREFGNTDVDYVVPAEAGSNYENTQTNKNIVMDLYFNYNKYLESLKTNIDFTGGYNYQDFRYDTGGFNFDFQNQVTNRAITIKERLNLQSFFGRATFTIDDKYILTGSLRADGSSRFNKDDRWGYFPAAAAAWKIKEENFLKDSSLISDLKLRASYGLTGQQDTGARYPSYALYAGSTNTAQYQIGYEEVNGQLVPVYSSTYRPLAYNSDLKWEETKTLNLGVDFGLFNNRITGAVEYYNRKTNDLIVFAQNPQGVNFSNGAYYNIGDMKNHGIEANLDAYIIDNDDLKWRVGGNITFQKSEITRLTNGNVPGFPGFNVGGISGGTGTTIQNNQVGFAPNSFFVYEQAYDVNGQPLDGVFVDRNGDGIINSNDLYRYRKQAPDFYYGFNTDLSYKNWWFSMTWRGSYGNYNYNNVFSNYGNSNMALPSNGNYLNNAHTNVLETGFTTPRYLSDYYVQDASFLRLDNVTLGYTFKNVFNEGTDMRLTGSVQNVFVITDYDGIDPENTSGIDNNIYPRPRTFTVGLNLNF